MSETKEEAQKKRLRKIREAAALPENIMEGAVRLCIGVSQGFKVIPPGAKKGFPRLAKPELAASKSLTTSLFKGLNPDSMKSRSGHYQAGFRIGIFVEGYDLLKREKASAEEEAVLLIPYIIGLRLGDEINVESKKKLDELIEKLRSHYASCVSLPYADYNEMTNGYKDAKKLLELEKRPFTEMDDRQQLNLLVVGLNRHGKNIRNVEELEKFAKTETKLKFQNSSDAFKKSANLIHWKGAKYSRSMRNRKKVDRAKKRSPVK